MKTRLIRGLATREWWLCHNSCLCHHIEEDIEELAYKCILDPTDANVATHRVKEMHAGYDRENMVKIFELNRTKRFRKPRSGDYAE